MYATPRSADATFIVAIGISPEGDQVVLPMSTIAGTRDPLIAEAYLRNAAGGGEGQIERACASMASRVKLKQVIRLEVRSQGHDLAQRGSAADTVVDDQLIASCDVP